jgi:type II secretory pathway pseudopilin PulG
MFTHVKNKNHPSFANASAGRPYPLCQRGKRGFSVLEVLVAATILGTTIVTVWTIFTFVTAKIAVSRARTVATNLATKQIETIRNMPFDQVGTTTGQPHGNLPATEIVTINNISYSISNTIRYYDDPLDGLVGGFSTGKHVHFYPTACNWNPNTTNTIRIDFYQDGVVYNVDFKSLYHGNQFNWSGSVTVGGTEQRFHLHTAEVAAATHSRYRPKMWIRHLKYGWIMRFG